MEKVLRESIDRTRLGYLNEIPPQVKVELEEVEVDNVSVRKAIMELKNGRAPGSGGISAELLKCITDKLYNMLI